MPRNKQTTMRQMLEQIELDTNISYTDLEIITKLFLAMIEDVVSSGNDVFIEDFGGFYLRHHKATRGKVAGMAYEAPERSSMEFRSCTRLKNKLLPLKPSDEKVSMEELNLDKYLSVLTSPEVQ